MAKYILWIFILFSLTGQSFLDAEDLSSASKQTRFAVEGIVYDAETGEPVPAATVQVVGAGRATSANKEGRFRLVLNRHNYEVTVSHVGHYSYRFPVSPSDTVALHEIRLKPLVIDMGTRQVFTRAYDPAQKIIAQAIARKRDILSRIHDYRSEAYMKFVLNDITRPDSSKIFLITESQTTSYWQSPGKFKEIITARKQSANIPAEGNLVALGEMTNFNRNRVEIGEYNIVSPVAVDAMESYNYYLLDTVFIDRQQVFVLEMEPKNEYEPLFVGEIHIADSTFDVVRVDVGFSKGVSIPFMKKLRYYQHLAQIEGQYWLPVEIGFTAEVDFNIPFPGIPSKLDFEYVASIYSYWIDKGHPSDVFDEYELEVDELADDIDSLIWAERQAIPLTTEEITGYQRIDSIKNAPQPLYKQLLKGMAGVSALFLVGAPDIYHFNRVEGTYAGLGIRPELFNHDLRLRLKTGYAFEDSSWQYKYGFDYRLWDRKKFRLGASIKDEITNRPTLVTDPNYNPTFFAYFFRIDPFDYYREKGWDISASVRPIRHLTLRGNYSDYEQSSLSKQVNYGVFRQSITPRENPPIDDGNLRVLSARLEYDSRRLIKDKGRDRLGFDREYVKLSLGAEYASPDLIDNDFDYRRYEARFRATKRIFGLGMTRLTGFAAASEGRLPPQRYFSVDFNNPDLFRTRGYNTLNECNFGGDRAAGFYIHHDFGKYAFRKSGISILKSLPVGLSIFGGVFWSEFRNNPIASGNEYIMTAPTGYSEIGIALTNLTPFLMPFNLATHFAWQLSAYETERFIWVIDLRF